MHINILQWNLSNSTCSGRKNDRNKNCVVINGLKEWKYEIEGRNAQWNGLHRCRSRPFLLYYRSCKKNVTRYSCLCSIIYILLLQTFDPGTVLYIYEYWPGYALITLRLLAWVFFVVYLFMTLKKHRKSGLFYYPLFIIYTLWLEALLLSLLCITECAMDS